MQHHDALDVTVPAWRLRFDVLLAQRAHQPFAWGRNDCCLFVADCVQACSGRDPAADLRGRYDTEHGAMKALAQLGGLAAAGARCGSPIAPLCAAAGDVGLIQLGSTQLLAVCQGEYWVSVAKDGLAVLPLAAALQAWRVAHG